MVISLFLSLSLCPLFMSSFVVSNEFSELNMSASKDKIHTCE